VIKVPKPIIDYSKVKTKEQEKELNSVMEICPVDVFALENNKIIVKNPDACIGCRACEAHTASSGCIQVKE
tara:strand:+ start:330 stop:542 length:213 start_codon:yes stop_codon:yes gene_type:complete